MKYLTKTILAIILVFSLTACKRYSGPGETQNTSKEQEATIESKKANKSSDLKVQEEIKQTLRAMWKAIELEDMEAYASYIHPDFTQFGETDSILRIGKEAELNGIAGWIEEASEIKTEMLEPRVTVRGDVAWIVYYWKDHGITDTGSFSTRGKSTRIFVKENDKWLCIHGHYTLLT